VQASRTISSNVREPKLLHATLAFTIHLHLGF